jgi:hypothetical protein
MNTKEEESVALGAPLFFTVPAYGFVMALYLDWLGRSYRGALSAQAFAQEIDPIGPTRSKYLRGMLNGTLGGRLGSEMP